MEWDNATQGTTYSVLVEFEDPSAENLLQNVNGLVIGQIYQFRHRVMNIYGWSPYSTPVYQLAAEVPSKPEAPISSNTLTSVTFDWTLPNNGGSFVTSYIIEFLSKDGEWHEQLSHCNTRTS